MASFSDSIRLTIDIVTGNARGQFRDLSASVKETEGTFGKMKAAGTGAFDMIKANAGAFAISAGTALVGFGVAAVNSFEKAALGAGELRDKLGLSADAASRWQEVAGDLGISTDSLSTSMGRMLKTAGATPQVFADLGVSIARAADGSVDANGTFLNVIDALHNMTDPAQRAAAAQKLLGKSWQQSAELIQLGAAGVKARLDDVQSAKIFTDQQISRSRKFRDDMDNIRDAAEGAAIVIGGKVADALDSFITKTIQVGTVVASVAKKIDSELPSSAKKAGLSLSHLWDGPSDVAKQFKYNLDVIKATITGVAPRQNFITSFADEAAVALDKMGASTETSRARTAAWFDNIEKSPALLEALGRSASSTSSSIDDQAHSAEVAAATLGNFKARVEEVTGAADAGKTAAEGFAGALDEVFGSTMSVQEASDAAAQNFADLTARVTEAQAGTEGYSLSLDDATDSGRANRDQVRQNVQGIEDYISTLAQSGATSDVVKGEYDKLRGGLVQQLGQFGLTEGAANDYINTLGLTPDNVNTAINLFGQESAKSRVLDYLHNSLDQIPQAKRTEILADLQRGDFNAALALINSIPRNVTVHINSTGGSSVTNPRGGPMAEGGPVRAGEAHLVGEKGPELFVPGANGTIVPNAGTGRTYKGGLASGGGGGSSSVMAAPVFNIALNVNVAAGLNKVAYGKELLNALTPALRTGGAGQLLRELGLATP